MRYRQHLPKMRVRVMRANRNALCGRGGTATAWGSPRDGTAAHRAQGAKHHPLGHLAVPLRLLFWRSLWDSSSFLPTTVRLAAMVERGCLHNT